MRRTAWRLFGTLGLALSAVATTAAAQDNYPAAPVRLVLGFPPGGALDTIGRVLAQKLSTQLNGSVIVDNKPGASGNIGAEFVAKSRPDGYTLLLNSSNSVLSPAFGEKLGYDLIKDLTPVGLVASSPFLVVVHPAVPASSIAEFIAYVKTNPDKLAYGSSGTGTIIHLSALLFLQANGLSALHVPYKGSSPAVLDLVGGRVQFSLQYPITVMPMVKDKRLRVLGITTLKRSALLPDVPTLSETVMPGFAMGGWYGVMAPAKKPPTIVRRLNAEIVKGLEDAGMKSRLAQEGAEPLTASPEEYGTYLRSELERWTKLIKSNGIKSE